MNKEILEGKLNEYKGKIKEKWGKLTDNDITQINGKREALLGKIQTRYGYAKERAEKELSEFEKSCGIGCGCGNKDKNHTHSDKNPTHADKTPTHAGKHQSQNQNRK